MKTCIGFLIFSFLFSISLSNAGNVELNWGNSCDTLLYDEFWFQLADSDYVQLIKKVDAIDEPDCQGNPSGNDVVAGTSKMGRGEAPGAPDGCFSQNTTVNIPCSGSDTTDTFYVRAWNDSTLNLATYYGDTRQNVGQETWVIHCNVISLRMSVTDSNSWNTGTEAPNIVYSSGNEIAPPSINPGDENVGMLEGILVTDKLTSSWSSIRVKNRVSGSCPVDSSDIDSVKVWKESGIVPGFDTGTDNWIGGAFWGPGSESGGEATISLSPVQILSTTPTTYYLSYDISTMADTSHCIGACLDDSSFISVDTPDCVSNSNFPICSGIGTGIEMEPSKENPNSFFLHQNTPNPFHSTTLIRYTLPVVGAYGNTPVQGSGVSGEEKIPVWLAIYDITGRFVETLVDESQDPGVYQLPITNHQLPGSGIYFLRLTARIGKSDDFTATQKMTVLK